MNLSSMLSESFLTEIKKGHVLVVAGAGISMDAPSCLPSWWGFNKILFDEIKSCAINKIPSLKPVLDELHLENIPVQAFSDLIVNIFAGPSYFPILHVLDCKDTNLNHLSLAEMAALKKLNKIVTTNFDTLIERAFRESGVSLTVVADNDDYNDYAASSTCLLYKVHGSVKESDTLVDTISQKAKGLPELAKESLRSHFKSNHILVIGFSGTDLEFDIDYLPFLETLNAGYTISWVIQPGGMSKIPVNVQKLAQFAGDKWNYIESKLPDIFSQIGIRVELPRSEITTQTQNAEENAKAEIRKFVEAPHVGGIACVAFFAGLFFEIGDLNKNGIICRELETLLKTTGDEVELTAVFAYQQLVSRALYFHEHSTAMKWITAIIDLQHAVQKLFDDRNILRSAEALSERNNSLAVTYNNLSIVYRDLGEFEEARKSLEVCLKYCSFLNNSPVQANAFYNLAMTSLKLGHSDDKVFSYLDSAISYSKITGNIKIEADCLYQKIIMSLANGELNRAARDIGDYGRIANLTGEYMLVVQHLQLNARLLAEHGRDEAAYLEFEKAISYSSGKMNLEHAFNVRRDMFWHLAHSEILRDKILDNIRQFGKNCKIENGKIFYTNDPIFNTETEDYINGLLNIVANAEPNSQPAFIPYVEHPDEETTARISLMRAYHRQDESLLMNSYTRLCYLYFSNGKSRKQYLEIARAFSYESVGRNDYWEMLSTHYVANALFQIGFYADGVRVLEKGLLLPKSINEALYRLIWENWITMSYFIASDEERIRILIKGLDEFPTAGFSKEYGNIALRLIRNYQYYGQIDKAVDRAKHTLSLCNSEEWKERISLLLSELESGLKAPISLPMKLEDSEPANDTPNNEPISFDAILESGWSAIFRQDYEAARKFLAKAVSIKEIEDDLMKVADCQLLLAECFAGENNMPEAIKWCNIALSNKNLSFDQAGVARALSSMAVYYYKSNEYKLAIKWAGECILFETQLIRNSITQIVMVNAYSTLAFSHAKQGALLLSKKYIQKAVEYCMPDYKMQPTLASLKNLEVHVDQSLADQNETTYEPGDIYKALEEAERLSLTKKTDAAISIINDIQLGIASASDLEVCQFYCVKGNVLQTSGMHEEAITAYAELDKFVSDVDLFRYYVFAKKSIAVSLRALGRYDESILCLKELLNQPVDSERANILLSLANSLWISEDGQRIVPESVFEEAKLLYKEAENCATSDSLRGLVLLGSAQVYIFLDESEQALAILEAAKHYLLKSNSQYIDDLEEQMDILKRNLESQS